VTLLLWRRVDDLKDYSWLEALELEEMRGRLACEVSTCSKQLAGGEAALGNVEH